MSEDDREVHDQLLLRAIQANEDPAELLAEVVAMLDSTPEPDVELIAYVGVGALEEIVRQHGMELWEEIESLARENVRFRRAMRSVWAYDSPEFERRIRLLGELGEWRPVQVSFVVEPSDLPAGFRVAWRTLEIRGEISPNELARVLREIADQVERKRPNGKAGRPSRRAGDT